MPRFGKHDLVKIATQPSNQWVHLVGECGYISEVQEVIDEEQFYEITTLGLENNCYGCGSVPERCLKEHVTPQLLQARNARLAQQQAAFDQYTKLQAAFEKAMRGVAAKWEIPYEKLLEMRRDIRDAEPC